MSICDVTSCMFIGRPTKRQRHQINVITMTKDQSEHIICTIIIASMMDIIEVCGIPSSGMPLYCFMALRASALLSKWTSAVPRLLPERS